MKTDKTAVTPCIITDCPVQHHRCGCGWLGAGQPCRHSAWREKWEAAEKRQGYHRGSGASD